ncbi:hypothetical protein KQX54_001884 [Cotesia glomerata]|uniref:Uncharacterized protein n=1 Tax=Cotesia glomerata TaxID=32391 RepID=A0AAV7HUT5_COTGL|nr:hypothetical protein KQX54_001812 [Cotesia glomerata]KAH0533815.1 hypothetical protein KQX54_001884 [Cotesia glomerata]
MKPKLALIQWIGGKYDQTYTAGVPVDWILDFDANTFDPTNEDESFVVEWRESKTGKIPKRGWKFYDAKVIRVSRSIKSLENEIAILEGVVSPLRPKRPDDDKCERFEGTNLESKYDNMATEQGEIASTSTGIGDAKKRKLSESIDKSDHEVDIANNHHKEKKKSTVSELSGNADDSDSFDELRSNQSNLKDKKSTKQMLLNLCQEMQALKEAQLEMLNAQKQAHQAQQPDQPVEIGHEGSNVFVTREQWDTANSRDTYGKMGVSLVRALFDDDVLIKSNLRGGTSKINKNQPRRSGLDSVIMAAITGKLELDEIEN